MVVVDGEGIVFGRLATQIAKTVLNGEEVQLINAEQLLLSGSRKVIIERFKARRKLQNKGTPERSPKWSKVPHMLVKRMIRGMLPHKTARGRSAFKKLMVYTGNPKKLTPEEKFRKFSVKSGVKAMKILDLCRMIGYSG
jgi:large subunit ribosomal protein L13